MSVHAWIREDLGEKGKILGLLGLQQTRAGLSANPRSPTLPTPFSVVTGVSSAAPSTCCDPLPWPWFSSQDGLLDQAELVSVFVTGPGLNLVWADLLNT